MNQFRGLGALARAYLLETLRSKTALFWSLAFPLVFVVGFSYIFAGGEGSRVVFMLPSILSVNLIAGSFFGISMNMVTMREKSVFRRYRVTPINSMTILLAFSMTSMLNLMISMFLQLFVAWALFKIDLTMFIFKFPVMAMLSAFAFIPLGLLVGSTAKDTKTAPAISNLLFFPMMFLSGSAMPLFMMPEWIHNISRFVPATYVVEVMQGIMARGLGFSDLLIPMGILLLTGIVAYVLNGLLFRWESSEPVNKKNLLIAMVSILGIYLVAFLGGTQLTSTERPVSKTASGETNAVALQGLTILDGLGNRIEDATIVINGDSILYAGASDDAEIPASAETVNCRDQYAIPGLIDSHVHIGGSSGGNASLEEYIPERLIRDLQSYLGVGVTGILSLTDNVDDLVRLRTAVENGTMRAPRIFLSGPSITAPNGHPAARFRFVPGLAGKMTRQVTSAEEARTAVRELVGKKVNIIKLVLEEGQSSQPLPRLSEAAFRAAVKEAHTHGLKVTVHVDSDHNIRLAIDAGADGLEHCPENISDETITLLREKGISITPTLAVYDGMAVAARGDSITDALVRQWVSPLVIKSLYASGSWLSKVRQSPGYTSAMEEQRLKAAETARRMVRAKVKIIAGSDAGNPATFHGPGLIRELEILAEEAGMTPGMALQTATSRPADRLGRHDLGRIAPGVRADLLLLRSDPEKDIRALRDIAAIYFNGKKLDRETLLSSSPGDWRPSF